MNGPTKEFPGVDIDAIHYKWPLRKHGETNIAGGSILSARSTPRAKRLESVNAPSLPPDTNGASSANPASPATVVRGNSRNGGT